MIRSGFLLAMVAAILMTAVPAAADWPEELGMALSGFIATDQGLDNLAPGDHVLVVGTIEDVDPEGVVPWYPSFYEYTLYTTGIVVDAVEVAGSMTTVTCQGGRLEVREDLGTPAEWGDGPVDMTAPPSFTDGTLWLAGGLEPVMLYLFPDHGMGQLAIDLLLDGGTVHFILGDPVEPVYGVWIINPPPSGQEVPPGYDAHLSGTIGMYYPTATGAATWSRVKALY
ncbi:MAG: hypothetical protein JW819_13050 [Candidatus Krumholzibacteriota bacterium]|nr:hypothetical protein [Candidatus Krumholzibacteriota bacterium]